MFHRYSIKYYLLLSIAGLFLILMLVIFPPTITQIFTWRKPVIGSVLAVLCILGILAVFLPKHCGQILNTGKEVVGLDASKSPRNVRQGHHPTCGKFSAHVFHIKEKTFCAACVGLLFGGLLALAGSVVYFFCGWGLLNNVLMVLLGSLGVFFGFFQFKFKNIIRLFVNSGFVLGAFFILVGVDSAVQSLFFDLFVITLIIFWLLTRIFLSQWDHELICSSCEDKYCKSNARKKDELTLSVHGI